MFVGGTWYVFFVEFKSAFNVTTLILSTYYFIVSIFQWKSGFRKHSDHAPNHPALLHIIETITIMASVGAASGIHNILNIGNLPWYLLALVFINVSMIWFRVMVFLSEIGKLENKHALNIGSLPLLFGTVANPTLPLHSFSENNKQFHARIMV
jgi:hypothetical protein